MTDVLSPPGYVAIGAAAVALLALGLAIALILRVRRLQRAQTAVLGDEERDLVAHAERLENGFTQLRDWVEESLQGLDRRMADGERRIEGCIAYRSVVRYDAYGEMSGRQSSSVALLDARRSGVVISSILHREHARIYVKQVREGEAELELAPEEQEAVDAALAGAGAAGAGHA